MKKIMIFFLLNFIEIAQGMEKLYFIAYPSPMPEKVIIEEVTSENVEDSKWKQDILHRMQQATQPPFIEFDTFTVYVAVHRKVKPFTKYSDLEICIEDYIFTHHYANNNERREALDRLEGKGKS